MTTSLRLAEHTERSRLEHGIRTYEFLLSKMDENRTQIEVQLTECDLIHRLLVARQHAPRNRARNPLQSRTVPERGRNRKQTV